MIEGKRSIFTKAGVNVIQGARNGEMIRQGIRSVTV